MVWLIVPPCISNFKSAREARTFVLQTLVTAVCNRRDSGLKVYGIYGLWASIIEAQKLETQ